MRGTIHRFPWGITVAVTDDTDRATVSGIVIHSTNENYPVGAQTLIYRDGQLSIGTQIELTTGTLDMLAYRAPTNADRAAARELAHA